MKNYLHIIIIKPSSRIFFVVDESDPERFGSDEPYVVFNVITEDMAEKGVQAWGFHTPVYGDVDDDGDRRPPRGKENLRIFGFTGPRNIDSSVRITATCFEHDLGDVSAITNKIRTALTSVATATTKGGPTGWIIAGSAIIAISLSYLVDLFGADDQIAKLGSTLSESQADSLTKTDNPYKFPAIRFDGGYDDGIYGIFVELERV